MATASAVLLCDVPVASLDAYVSHEGGRALEKALNMPAEASPRSKGRACGAAAAQDSPQA